MCSQDINDMAIAVLVVIVALLVVDNVWLHVRTSRLDSEILGLREQLDALRTLDSELSLIDRTKSTFSRLGSAAAKGLSAAKEELSRESSK